jgi:tRNA-Thr(GGU) m(6)t(6)A37 methyltransferase TsaA
VAINPKLSEILDGIEGFSHILVLYWPHLVPEKRRKLQKVHPMGRKDIPRQGIFATCSPARPNPVLVTAVRLLERNGNVLRVQGLEAVDGSPVVDIKPYNPRYYRVENPIVPEWMKKLQDEISD